MTKKEFDITSSEIQQLKLLLADIPPENIIEQKSFESRIQLLEDKIKNISPETTRNRAIMTFRGNPVIKTHGIVAEFASRATSAFTEAVVAIAASLTDNLKYMGPIPNRDKNQLLITGTAIGSFGFEFEVPKADEDSLFIGSSETEIALEKLQELFRASISDDDDLLTELVEEIHPRAVIKAVDFLDVMRNNNAWCALSFKERTFRFLNIHQIETSMLKLSQDNIDEQDVIFNGEFQGILPSRRAFEFKSADGIITGKIGAEIKEPDVLNREYLHKIVSVQLHKIQVGQGRPRYQLVDLKFIQ